MPPRRYQVAPATPTDDDHRQDDEQAENRSGHFAHHLQRTPRVPLSCDDDAPSSPPVATRQQSTALAVPRTRSSGSALEMQYPMWLVPLHNFLGLTALLPHQELRRQNKLVQHDPIMRTVIFVSHQWTAFHHPDHTGRQLRTLQRMFQRMLSGEVPTVDAHSAIG